MRRLFTLDILEDSELEIAFNILFQNTAYKLKWSQDLKAKEMRKIIKGDISPCEPFINWYDCVRFIEGQYVDDEYKGKQTLNLPEEHNYKKTRLTLPNNIT